MNESDHRRAYELLPWLVNGRLQGEDLRWLNAHVDQCTRCRGELQAQRRVHEALAGDSALEFAPLASYHRLWDRIEADASPPPAARPLLPAARRRGWPLLVAGLAAQSVAIVALALALWQSRTTSLAPAYRTVTSASPVVAEGSILVIVDDRTTQAEFRSLLGRSGLKVHDGPTAGGVYTLVRDPLRADGSPDAALQTLRNSPQVRFAERSVESTAP
jgi:hypothetical protein